MGVDAGMKVEIWSDVVCPWCYVGKRRFEQALEGFAGRDEVEVVWRAFELDPSAPRERTGDYAVRLAEKYGTDLDAARAMIATMTDAAAQDGLDFRFDVARVGNTFDAHRLLHWAHLDGRQDALKERLLRATFTEGEPIGDHDVLVRLAGEVGLDEGRGPPRAHRRHPCRGRPRGRGAGARLRHHRGAVLRRRRALRRVRGAAGGAAAGGAGPGLDAGPPAAGRDGRRVRPRLRGRHLRGLSAVPPGDHGLPRAAERFVAARRSARLAALPAGAAALAVEGLLRRATGQDRDVVARDLRRRNAARTRRTLGELKGGALKAGQLLSTVEALFPQDPESTWRSALTDLQEANQPLPFDQVEPVLLAELGPSWRQSFTTFEPVAAAAASLGQVHRATWHDGREVAVKVQYPGVREALVADLRTLSVLSRATALVARGLALPPLVTELRDRLLEELDYEREARTQQDVGAAYAGDPDVLVPAVLRATSRVLVMDWIDGTPLAQVAQMGTPQQRARAAERYQRFLVSGPERAGWLHTDPHPGNFRMLADGRLGVLDFGSALRLDGMPPAFGRLIAALLADDPQVVLARLREAGFVRPGVQVDVVKLVDYMSPFTVPARHERFTFTREWLRSEFARANDPRAPEFGVALQLNIPAEHLFTHRVWLGLVGVLCQLEAEVPVRSVLSRWLPGFSVADPAEPLR